MHSVTLKAPIFHVEAPEGEMKLTATLAVLHTFRNLQFLSSGNRIVSENPTHFWEVI